MANDTRGQGHAMGAATVLTEDGQTFDLTGAAIVTEDGKEQPIAEAVITTERGEIKRHFDGGTVGKYIEHGIPGALFWGYGWAFGLRLPPQVESLVDRICIEGGLRIPKATWAAQSDLEKYQAIIKQHAKELEAACKRAISEATRAEYTKQRDDAIRSISPKNGSMDAFERDFRDDSDGFGHYLSARFFAVTVYAEKALQGRIHKAILARARKEYGGDDTELHQGKPFKQYMTSNGIPLDGYSAMRQNRGINALMLASKKRFPSSPNGTFKGINAYYSYKDVAYSVTIIAPEPIYGKMTATVQKLYTFALRVFTSSIYQNADDETIEGKRHLRIFVDDYMQTCEIKNEQAAIRQMRESITELIAIIKKGETLLTTVV